MKVAVLGFDYTTLEMFLEKGWEASCTYDVGECLDADLTVWTGGTDINPILYGEEPDEHTQPPDNERDLLEMEIYNLLSKPDNNRKKVGICRGAQFLNVMNGGKLIQHFEGHTNCNHWATEIEHNLTIKVNSDHHQGILINRERGRIILEVDPVPGYTTGLVEACYYPTSSSLCFQPHPEWKHFATHDYFFKLLNRFLGCN